MTCEEGSITLLLPGHEDFVLHARESDIPPGDIAMTLVIRRMHKDHGTQAADGVDDALLSLREKTPLIVDWDHPEQSRLVYDRVIPGVVELDRSIRAVLSANPGICLRQLAPDRWSPGDVFTKASVAGAVGLQQNTLGGAVKGSIAGGGAVSLWWSGLEFVTVIERSTGVGKFAA
jgi:hypothetical protein